MIGKPIVSRFAWLQQRWRHPRAARTPQPPDLHSAWVQRHQLPRFVQDSPIATRCLDLLGPLGWDHFPERDLERNWGQPTIPYAAFIPACLLKLNEDKKSMGDLRLFWPSTRN